MGGCGGDNTASHGVHRRSAGTVSVRRGGSFVGHRVISVVVFAL